MTSIYYYYIKYVLALYNHLLVWYIFFQDYSSTLHVVEMLSYRIRILWPYLLTIAMMILSHIKLL